MAVRELRTGEQWVKWNDEFRKPLIPNCDLERDLFVAYFASAEMECYLELAQELPRNVLCLFAEYRNATNGKRLKHGRGLQGALTELGINSNWTADKKAMQVLAGGGGPFTTEQKRALMEYCSEDVVETEKLFLSLMGGLEINPALLRGAYSKSVARMTHLGIPIDVATYTKLRDNWVRIKSDVVRSVNKQYGVFRPREFSSIKPSGKYVETFRVASEKDIDPYQLAHVNSTVGDLLESALLLKASPDDVLTTSWTFSQAAFGDYLKRIGRNWELTPSGRLATDDETFRQWERIDPGIAPLRQLLSTLSEMKLFERLAIGADGRNRCLLSQFSSLTGRNQPSSAKFIFGGAAWTRSLIVAPPGKVLISADWSGQEFAIGAYLSGDANMISDYEADDPYLAFGKRIGACPSWATKDTHNELRGQLKVAAGLGAQYGAGSKTVAAVAGVSGQVARRWLRSHRMVYSDYWRFSDRVLATGQLRRRLTTKHGWQAHHPFVNGKGDTKPTTIRNFPMQAHGADMLRIAIIKLHEAGVDISAPLHDSVLCECAITDSEHIAELIKDVMAEASDVVLGARIRTDAAVIPERYSDPRGEHMWETLTDILKSV